MIEKLKNHQFQDCLSQPSPAFSNPLYGLFRIEPKFDVMPSSLSATLNFARYQSQS
jgi:hypothetical protein